MLTVARASVIFSVQNWLSETPDSKKTAATPGYFSVGMSRKFGIFSTQEYNNTLTPSAVMSVAVVSPSWKVLGERIKLTPAGLHATFHATPSRLSRYRK